LTIYQNRTLRETNPRAAQKEEKAQSPEKARGAPASAHDAPHVLFKKANPNPSGSRQLNLAGRKVGTD
jgi:hypothetical protein